MTDQYRPDWPGDIAEPIAEPTYEYSTPVVYDQAVIVEPPPVDEGLDGADQGKAGAAKEQAAVVGQGAAQAGQQVASVAKDQAQNVAAEAGSQAKDLVSQAKDEITAQAGTQQQRLAETLRALGDELQSMAQHDGEKSTATDLVSQASTRSHDAASWLESREPGQLLSDVQDFARRRPGAFLALAAGAGLAAGRLGRGVKDAGTGDTPTQTPASGAAETTVTRVDQTPATGGVSSYEPDHLDDPDGSVRPFGSSQDSAYLYDGGPGL